METWLLTLRAGILERRGNVDVLVAIAPVPPAPAPAPPDAVPAAAPATWPLELVVELVLVLLRLAPRLALMLELMSLAVHDPLVFCLRASSYKRALGIGINMVMCRRVARLPKLQSDPTDLWWARGSRTRIHEKARGIRAECRDRQVWIGWISGIKTVNFVMLCDVIGSLPSSSSRTRHPKSNRITTRTSVCCMGRYLVA